MPPLGFGTMTRLHPRMALLDTPAAPSSSTTRYALATLALFTLLTVAMTWPQARYATDRVSDPGDPLLNTWALAWVAHQLPYSPAHVFDGNIFHPERRTLAYSESLLAPGGDGRAAAVPGCRTHPGLQRVDAGVVRPLGGGDGAAGARPHGERPGRGRRRRHLCVPAVPLRPLPALPVAAGAVDATGVVGVPSAAGRGTPGLERRAGAGRRAARRCRRCTTPCSSGSSSWRWVGRCCWRTCLVPGRACASWRCRCSWPSSSLRRWPSPTAAPAKSWANGHAPRSRRAAPNGGTSSARPS